MGGFVVKVFLMNQEFNKVVEHLPLVELNTTTAREYLGEIKCDILLGAA